MRAKQILRDLRELSRMSWLITIAVAVLLVVGVLFVYSSCFVSPEQPVRLLYKKQGVWAVVGVLCYLVFAVVDYRSLRKLSWWIYASSLVMLVLVLFVGPLENGARRRLALLGLRFQPSELAKLAVILVLARKLSQPGVNLGHFKPLALAIVVVALPVVLIMREPDLGTAMILLPVLLFILFGAGVPLRSLMILILVGLACVGVVLAAVFVPPKLGMDEEDQDRILRACGLSRYQRDRIVVFFRSEQDPLGMGWNRKQSEIAVGSGGARGKGFLKGSQNILGFLPRSVAPTDFIYSVIAEEEGFFGSVVVLSLFALVTGCGMGAALSAKDKMGRLLCVGIVALVFSHVSINIAMTVGLMPITGLPLPLLSYGGSFMVVMMSALGIVQSVHIRSRRKSVVFEQGALWTMT
ncbi:rod shape-determining protein RodA [Verrucomicrobiota bacterium]